MAVGVPQELSFTGSATHGGGSCQISVTLDQKPTKDSEWKCLRAPYAHINAFGNFKACLDAPSHQFYHRSEVLRLALFCCSIGRDYHPQLATAT